MAAVDYGTYAGSLNKMQNYVPGSTNVGLYPDSNQINVFGPIYLPRIYGKDLTSFEIASSGSVGITLSDIYSFDLSRNVANSNVILQTLSNDALTIQSASNLYLGAADDIYINGDSLNVDMSNAVSFIAPELHFMSTVGDTTFVSHSNWTVNSSNDVSMYSHSNSWFKADSNVYLQSLQSDVLMTAGHNVSLAASNGVVLVAKTQDISLTAETTKIVLQTLVGDVDVTSAADINLTAAQAITMVATADDLSMTTSDGDILLASASNYQLTANKAVTMTASTANMTMSAGSNVNITGQSNVFLTATTEDLVGKADRSILFTATSNDFSVLAKQAVSLTASSNNLTLASSTLDIVLDSARDILATADRNMHVTVVGDYESTAVNYTVTASTSAVINGTTLAKLEAGANSYLSMAPLTANLQSKDIFIGDVDLNKYKMVGHSDTSTLDIMTANNINVSASNNINESSTNHYFKNKLGTENIVSIEQGAGAGGSNLVTVYGNLDVMGVINSVTITEQSLEIADKTIVLAHDTDPSATIADGSTTNDRSGLVVAGMPAAIVDQSLEMNVDCFEKSLKWFNGSGGMGALRTNAATESFWELKGGAFRISSTVPTNDWTTSGAVSAVDDISFTFRINDRKALELVRTVVDPVSGTPSYDRVAVFGLQRNFLL